MKRVVLTGGPAAGKTTALSLLKREFIDSTVVVPESATTLFDGGMPRPRDEGELKTVQSAILSLQMSMETVYIRRYQCRLMLCDRGTLDGAAYWPGDDFFETHGTTAHAELGRYDGVFHLRTSALLASAGGIWERHESAEEAIQLDNRLRDIWSQHPRYVEIPAGESLLAKIVVLTEHLKGWL